MLKKNQLHHLKSLLTDMKTAATKTEERTDQAENLRDESGELSMYDNHPADMATALFDRERDDALEIHAKEEEEKVDEALEAMQKGTYGKCEACGKDIEYERLLIIPYTTLCAEHANSQPSDLETDTAFNERSNPFEDTKDGRAIDPENSFEEVAKYGTSDSPSDFYNQKNYSNGRNDNLENELTTGDSITNRNDKA